VSSDSGTLLADRLAHFEKRGADLETSASGHGRSSRVAAGLSAPVQEAALPDAQRSVMLAERNDDAE
jgi:hypothetical protein